MTSCLVTGAEGQLGQCFQEVANAFPQHQLIFTTRKELDLDNTKTLEKIFEVTPFEFILNCAAYTKVDRAESEKEKAVASNQTAVANLINFALPRELKIIHFSTDFVFDGTQNRPYKETDTPNPLNIYGETKLKGELLLEKAALNSVIVRTSWLFSPYGANFVKTILGKINSKEELKIISDQFGKPTYGLDLARTILQSIDYPRFYDFPLYHFAQDYATSWYGFAKKISEFSGEEASLSPIKSVDFSSTIQRPYFSVLETQRIQKTLSLSLRNWEDALEECIHKIQLNESF